METLELRNHIIEVLSDEAKTIPLGEDDLEVALITDSTHDHYQILYLGWQGPRRTYTPFIHVRIVAGKAYIERDGTEDGMATRLEARGVPRSQIVLAFHPPFKRPLTDYAVA